MNLGHCCHRMLTRKLAERVNVSRFNNNVAESTIISVVSYTTNYVPGKACLIRVSALSIPIFFPSFLPAAVDTTEAKDEVLQLRAREELR